LVLLKKSSNVILYSTHISTDFLGYLRNLVYNIQRMRKQSRLQKAFSSYKKKKTTKKSLLSVFWFAMPVIIFRTTKLEGEPVTKRMINALFK